MTNNRRSPSLLRHASWSGHHARRPDNAARAETHGTLAYDIVEYDLVAEECFNLPHTSIPVVIAVRSR
jgi:hypothetical protein